MKIIETMAQAIPKTALEVFNMLPEGTHIQLINDTLIMSPAPTEAHQRMVMFLSSEINNCVRKHKLGHVYPGPIDVELNTHQVYQPDIIFISNANKSIIHEKRIYGGPDLVIEILSPGTAKYDKNEKFVAYQAAGVKEYWMVDVDVPWAFGYTINQDGIFEERYKQITELYLATLDGLHIDLTGF
jgi:Uma2 family endonuclease